MCWERDRDKEQHTKRSEQYSRIRDENQNHKYALELLMFLEKVQKIKGKCFGAWCRWPFCVLRLKLRNEEQKEERDYQDFFIISFWKMIPQWSFRTPKLETEDD